MNKISKSYKILKDAGVTEFARQFQSYVSDLFYSVFWRIKDHQTINIGGVSGNFYIPTYEVFKSNQYRVTTEKEVFKDLLSELNSNDVFWDVGANTGLYSILASERCHQGQIVAFEPYPPNFELLLKNMEINSIDSSELYDLALSDEGGIVEFNQPDSEKAGYGSASIQTGNQSNLIEVPASSGDSLVETEDVPLPNVIKIDVEGAEPLVIEGMTNVLATNECRLLYCEVHLEATEHRPSIEEFGSSLDNLVESLESCGFTVDRLQERKGELFLKCSK